MVSGGDRHGCEPNANLNLTNATGFSRVGPRVARRADQPDALHAAIHEPIVARFYQTFLDAIREYPDHADGACRWDQRTFHPGPDGVDQPISALWAFALYFSRGSCASPAWRRRPTC